MGELISVIVPVYNTGLYLRRCIESIIAQDYDNLEIIIVDDGSTDLNTVKLCDELAREYDNVSTYHKANGGQSSARNYGISVSKGEYIGFIDSDDLIDSNMYSSLYRSIVQHNVMLAIGGIATEDNGKLIDRLVSVQSGCYHSHDLLHHFFLGQFHSSCTNLYHKDLFEYAKFPENEINEDYMLNYLIFKNLECVYVDEKVYYHYIRRDDSTTGAPVSLKFLSWIEHTTRILDDYKDTTLHEEADYQYIYSNIILGNKCLLGLARGKNDAADELYKLISNNLSKIKARVRHNKFLSFRNKVSGVLLAYMPGIYKFLVLLGLKFKYR